MALVVSDYSSGIQSDSEVSRRPTAAARPGASLRTVHHSDAEMSDYEPPVQPGPGKTVKQAALETLNSGPRRSRPQTGHIVYYHRPRSLQNINVLLQPGHHDKSIRHLRRFFMPQRIVKKYYGPMIPGAGRYGDSELARVQSYQSQTESEGGGDTDNDQSFIFDEEGNEAPETGNEPKSSSAFKRPIPTFSKRRRKHYFNDAEPQAPGILEPTPVDLSKYDATARLWLEQVDQKTVQKCKTMYLTVLPANRELPSVLISSPKYKALPEIDDPALPPQWVMARGRTMHDRKAREEALKQQGDGDDTESIFGRPGSPGRQLLLFFRIGGVNWLDLAWVLFDTLQTDPETVRMIKDIELRNPGGLTDQVHDLMHRWWRIKGAAATIEELQRALDTVHMPYISEEFYDQSASIVAFSDTEDNLDVQEISAADPDVSRLNVEYNRRSLNASFAPDSAAAMTEPPNPDDILKRLQRSGKLEPGSGADKLVQLSRASASSRDASFAIDRSFRHDLSKTHSSQESLNDVTGTVTVAGDVKKQKPVPAAKPQLNSKNKVTKLFVVSRKRLFNFILYILR